MFKITLTALFIFFTSLNYLSAQDTNNTKSGVILKNLRILNCDLSTVVMFVMNFSRYM